MRMFECVAATVDSDSGCWVGTKMPCSPVRLANTISIMLINQHRRAFLLTSSMYGSFIVCLKLLSRCSASDTSLFWCLLQASSEQHDAEVWPEDHQEQEGQA